jgi:hypothetical protein
MTKEATPFNRILMIVSLFKLPVDVTDACSVIRFRPR